MRLTELHHPGAGGGAPALERALTPRPRLLALLAREREATLTVLAAPAGYGKSALASQWVARLGLPSAWLALGPDDDGARASARMAAALGRLREQRGPGGDGVLVVDRVDAAPEGAGAAALAGLGDFDLPQVRVVAIARSARLAAQLGAGAGARPFRLGPAELAFDDDEARQAVRQLAGVALTEAQVAVLMARTDGWPIAVKVAAIALRGGGDPDALLEGLHGGERHLAAFLREEVLGPLPPAGRQFLSRTSVLDQLDAGACRAVAGPALDAAGRVVLERDDLPCRRPWAGGANAHHPLFRDFLRRELRASGREEEAALLGRAAAWYADRGDTGAAARCYLEAGAWDELLALVDRCGPGMVDRGGAPTVLAWVDGLPGVRRPEVALRRAHLLTTLGDSRRAEHVLREVAGDLGTAGEQVVLEALRASWAFLHAAPSTAVRAADAVLEALASTDLGAVPDVLGMTSRGELRAAAAVSRGRATWLLGDVAAGREQLRAAITEPAAGPWQAHALGTLALLEAWAGDHAAALALARRALPLATGRRARPAGIEASLALASVARQVGDLARAEHLLGEVAAACSAQRPTTLAVHAIEEALWHLARGRPDDGLAALAGAAAAAGQPRPQLLTRRWTAAEAKLLLARGDRSRADRLLAGGRFPWGPELAAVAVQASIVRRDLLAAAHHLDAWPTGGEPRDRVEREWWAAILDLERGRRRPAVHRGVLAVSEALAGGHRAMLVDAGDAGRRLLRAVQRANPTPAIADLLGAAPSPPATDTPWGLSQRELEVLRYLRQPLAGGEIAQELFISLNTLKTHLRTIYRKLGVDGREQAVRLVEQRGTASPGAAG